MSCRVSEPKPVAILTSYWLSWLSWIPSSWFKSNNDLLLIQAFKRLNIQSELVVWNQTNIDWTKYQAVVIRSTWDYHKTKKNTLDFLSLLQRIENLKIVLLNPRSTIEWNIDKTYLRELYENGISVVETLWIGQEELALLQEKIREKGWSNCVIKPVVSASGMHTKKFHVKDSKKVAQELSSFDIDRWMVQPFMEEIVEEGELSFIFFLREFSHCVLKKPAQGGFLVQSGTVYKFDPSPDLIEQAEKILTLANQETLYARVDVIRQKDKLVLMELELIEPNLYLQFKDNAAERFASAISYLAQQRP